VWILLQFRQATLSARLVYVGLFVAGVGMALVPVGVRNQVVGGEFFLTTAQVGPNFFIGNNDRANGLYAPLRWARGDALREREDATQLAEAALGIIPPILAAAVQSVPDVGILVNSSRLLRPGRLHPPSS